MRPPKILVETEVVDDGVVWKIKKALYGLRASPIAWETERDNPLKSLTWSHDETEFRLLPCPASPCLWTVIPLRPGEDPSVKTSKEELTRGVVTTYVDDLLLTGWQHHINSITKALLAKYVMKRSGALQKESQMRRIRPMELTFWELESLGMKMAQCGAINPKTFSTA